MKNGGCKPFSGILFLVSSCSEITSSSSRSDISSPLSSLPSGTFCSSGGANVPKPSTPEGGAGAADVWGGPPSNMVEIASESLNSIFLACCPAGWSKALPTGNGREATDWEVPVWVSFGFFDNGWLGWSRVRLCAFESVFDAVFLIAMLAFSLALKMIRNIIKTTRTEITWT